jgi:hypothetical protein
MEKIKVNFSEISSDFIFFSTNYFYNDNQFFLIDKNFERMTTAGLTIQRYHLNLNTNLNLKEFKIEVSE